MHHTAIDLGLSRVKKIASALSLDSFNCPVITIAGTNGKGSCVACLEAIYTAAGYQVAAYTSPHLLDFNERIRVSARSIDDAYLLRAFALIDQVRIKMGVTLSFFEFTTLAALCIFKEVAPDVILLEVGLGGRLDATNIIDNHLAILTSIGIDHTDWLGDTREKIAAEKMGIARKDGLLIFGETDEPTNIEFLANQYETTLLRVDQKRCHGLSYPLALKAQNVSTALTAVDVLQERLPVSIQSLQKGLSSIRLPGRFEVHNLSATLILDVAHNVASTSWLAEQLKRSFPGQRIVAVFGAMKDKMISQMIAPLSELIDAWYLVDLPVERAEKAEGIAQILDAQSINKWYTFSSVSAAMEAAINVEQVDCVLVFGSFYTVADAKRWLKD